MPFRHLTNVVDLTECRPKNTIFTAFKNIRQKIKGKIKQSNMSNIKFQSDLNGKQQTVKVDIKQGPFAKGVQAKVSTGTSPSYMKFSN
jgi:hypothetical protein